MLQVLLLWLSCYKTSHSVSQGANVVILPVAEYISTQTTFSGTMEITKEYVCGCSGLTKRWK